MSGFTVFIVDDDPGVLKALSRFLRAADYETRTFASPRAFLAAHDPSVPGCAVFDVAMPDVDGLALQRALAAGGVDRSIVFITGKGDVPTSVRAMKAGAIDFLTKPVSNQDLLEAIRRAEELDFAPHPGPRQTADRLPAGGVRAARRVDGRHVDPRRGRRRHQDPAAAPLPGGGRRPGQARLDRRGGGP